MAAKKKKVKARRKIVKRATVKKKTKTSFVNIGIIAVVAVVLLFVLYSIPAPVKPHRNGLNGGSGDNIGIVDETVPAEAGDVVMPGDSSCDNNRECLITYCKGEEKLCLNTKEAYEHVNVCDNYSDWVIETQDASLCACVDSICRMVT